MNKAEKNDYASQLSDYIVSLGEQTFNRQLTIGN